MEENKNLDVLDTLENLYNCTKDLSPWSLMFALTVLNPGLPETIERLRPYKKKKMVLMIWKVLLEIYRRNWIT